MTLSAAPDIRAPVGDRGDAILTRDALDFVHRLHAELDGERRRLLARRAERQAELDAGARPDFLAETRELRDGDWRVAAAPADLQDRRVEITGPVDRKMMINALNSGATGFMADFEDANSPTWTNVVEGQANLVEAVEGTLAFDAPDGRAYRLADDRATLLVRPRGWHLPERHVEIGGAPVAASLFDFGLYVFHCARRQLERGSGPYLYLPKLESHLEARLWADAFALAEDTLGLDRGTIKATVLIETILAAFEMDEILWELREHSPALNAGRWDYIFSVIKKFRERDDVLLPDRAQVTMTVPFMRAYATLLVKTCHARGAHAIGGMAAFIPSRRDAELNQLALGKVREDKEREATDGFDGTWVAHPDLVPTARAEFDRVLGDRPNQVDRQRPDVTVGADELLDFAISGGEITDDGVRENVGVGLRYLDSWLGGVGAAAINNLMEDVATAEISRAQLWQWTHRGAVDAGRVRAIAAEEAGGLRDPRAAELFERVALADHFEEFLTLPAYDYLED
jgi:malate synthase